MQNSLVTRCRCCSLQNSLVNPYRSCLLQKVSRYLLQNLLVARCKNSLITHYSLQKFLVSKNHSPPVAKNLLVTRCEIRLLLVCRNCSVQKSLVSHCNIPSILIPKNHASLKQAPAGIIVCLKSTKLDESFSFFNIICFLVPKNSKLFKSTYYAEICC